MRVPFLSEFFVLSTCRKLFLCVFVVLAACLGTFAQEAAIEPEVSETESKSPGTAAHTSPTPPQDTSSIKITFDKDQPGVIFVESNGERVKVDTGKQTVEQVAMLTTTDTDPAVDAAKTDQTAAQAIEENPYDLDEGEEPYDYRVVNMPTPKKVPKGTWNLAFTHRFTQPVHPIDESGPALLGLDSFGIASFGVTYGITDKLYASAYRSPLCQRGLCRTIEIGLGYNWIAHDKDSPFALSTYASIEGNDNFTDEYTYNLQAMFSARIDKRLYLFFSPAVHINSNGQRRFDPRANEFFPPALVAETFFLPTHGATFGFGAEVMITPNVVALFDIAARTGFKLGTLRPQRNTLFGPITGFENESHPSMGLGIQRNIGRHSFALTFTNTQATTTSRYNSSSLTLSPKGLIIGFNLARRF